MNRISPAYIDQLIALVRAGKLSLTDVIYTTSKPVLIYQVIRGNYCTKNKPERPQ